jgi:hypothetical protein
MYVTLQVGVRGGGGEPCIVLKLFKETKLLNRRSEAVLFSFPCSFSLSLYIYINISPLSISLPPFLFPNLLTFPFRSGDWQMI